ncbi:MAG: hypothetical protein BWY09_01043 [Candidatus Hydrogenedentes bacterium ADurb.Bin179]|nr:MAG: hypothetical protein BWY09_01043 [Candidatus Hydrogenedentes bacterium ADurb.Bin179]
MTNDDPTQSFALAPTKELSALTTPLMPALPLPQVRAPALVRVPLFQE